MAGSLGTLLKATIEVAVKGAGTAKNSLRSLGSEIESLGSKRVSGAGYAAQAKALQQLGLQAQGVGRAFSLTRQEALTLNYTIGDIVASIASGASPLTILLQQGGQVRDGFGSLSNLLSKIAAQFVRFAPQIAVIGAAIGAITFTKMGESAAEAADEIGKLSDQAGVAIGTFQDLEAAASVKGISSGALAQSLNALRNSAIKSAAAERDFNERLSAGRDATTGIIKDTKLLAEYRERLGSSTKASGDALRDIGVNTTGFVGSAEQTRKLFLDVASAISSLAPGSLKAQQALQELEGIVGRDGVKFFKLGIEGIKKYAAEVDSIAPKLTNTQVEQGKRYEESVRLYEDASKRLSDATGAIFIPAAQAKQDFFFDLLKARADAVRNFRGVLEFASNTIVEFFRVISGRQANFTSPFLAGFVDGLRIVRDAISALPSEVGQLFETLKGYAREGLSAVDQALGSAGGRIGAAYGRIKAAVIEAANAVKNASSGLSFDPKIAGVALGIATAIKGIELAAKTAAPIVFSLGRALTTLALRTIFTPATLGIAPLLAAAAAVDILVINWDRVSAAIELAGAALNSKFLAPLRTFGLQASGILLTVAGVFLSIGDAAIGLFKLLDFTLLIDAIKGSLQAVDILITNLLIEPLKDAAKAFIQILNILWKGAGDALKKNVDDIISSQNKYVQKIAGNFKPAQEAFKKAVDAEGVQKEADKAYEVARKRFEDISKLDGTLYEDQAKRLATQRDQLVAQFNKATGLNINPNDLSGSAYKELERLIDGVEEKAKSLTSSIKENGSAVDELGRKTSTIRIFRAGPQVQEVKVVTEGVKQLSQAVDGVNNKEVQLRVIKGGVVTTVQKEVEDLGAAADKTSEKLKNVGTGRVEIDKVVAPKIDSSDVDIYKQKLDETKKKQDELQAAPLSPASAAPVAQPQASPLAAPISEANTAIDALKQKLAQAISDAQALAAEAVSIVANSIVSSVGTANTSIDSLTAALNRAIQSVQQLASALSSLPALPDYSGSNTGGGVKVNGGGGAPMASGGLVSGPGTATSDSIPAWLSAGEFVVRAAAVSHYGVDFLRRINGLRISTPRMAPLRFADGGLVSSMSRALGPASGGSRSLTLVLEGKSFGGLTGPSTVIADLEKHAISRRIASTTKRAPSWER